MPDYSQRSFGATIDTAEITDLAVTNAKIANLTITGAKIASGTITYDKLSFSSNNLLSGLTPSTTGSWTNLNRATDDDLTTITQATLSDNGTATITYDLGALKIFQSIFCKYEPTGQTFSGINVVAKLETSPDNSNWTQITEFDRTGINGLLNTSKIYTSFQTIRYLKITLTVSNHDTGILNIYEVAVHQ